MSSFARTGAATSAALTSAFAPGMTTMVLSALAIVMRAVPVWASDVCCTKLRSTPCAAKNAFSSSPKESLPSRPISLVGAPSFAAATAWLAPLPPGKYSTALPAMVSPIRGCRSAVATTSMLMLPATKTRAMTARLIPELLLASDLKLQLDRLDIGQRRQSGLIAELLNLVSRGRARKLEVVLPAFAGTGEIGIDVSAMEYVTRAVGVEHALGRDRKRGQGANRPRLVIPEQAFFPHGHAADAAAAALEIIQHLFRRQVHLLAQPLGHDGDVDELQQLVCVGAQPAAVERGQNSVLAAELCVVDRGIRLVAVDMQRAAAFQVQHRKGMDMLVVSAAK